MKFNFIKKLLGFKPENSKPEHVKPKHIEIYGYDFDGVVSLGINPRNENDVIITGRCIDETEYVYAVLKERGIKNKVYFNPMTLEERGNHTLSARRHSGKHKAITIRNLKANRIHVQRFFEDDRVQAKIINEKWPKIEIVEVISKLVEK